MITKKKRFSSVRLMLLLNNLFKAWYLEIEHSKYQQQYMILIHYHVI